MRPDALTIRAGGTPTPAQLAALAAAVTAVVEGERGVPVDPTPFAYRSRWRRAAMLESSEVPENLKGDGVVWSSH